jgi:hypothetical protein
MFGLKNQQKVAFSLVTICQGAGPAEPACREHTRRPGVQQRHLRAVQARRIVRSSRPQEIFQPPQQGFFNVHAQLQLLGNIFQLFPPQLTSQLIM